MSSRRCVRTASVQTHARSRRGEVAVGQFVVNPGGHGERERPIAPDILKLIAEVGARQRTEREHPRHEAQVGVRFTGRDELRHLVELGEVAARLCVLPAPSRPLSQSSKSAWSKSDTSRSVGSSSKARITFRCVSFRTSALICL